jgi:GrpB-like predicted nucleotidyltransferase (UPF0157 family)
LSILDRVPSKLVVAEYEPAWGERGSALAAELLAALTPELSPYRWDHVPAGWDDPPERWAKRLWSRRGHAEPDVNLHVRVLGSPNERVALLFRDWFRTHPEAVPGYARFKRSLAAAVPDIGTYSDIKDPVIDVIIAVAGSWASETGGVPHTQPAR